MWRVLLQLPSRQSCRLCPYHSLELHELSLQVLEKAAVRALNQQGGSFSSPVSRWNFGRGLREESTAVGAAPSHSSYAAASLAWMPSTLKAVQSRPQNPDEPVAEASAVSLEMAFAPLLGLADMQVGTLRDVAITAGVPRLQRVLEQQELEMKQQQQVKEAQEVKAQAKVEQQRGQDFRLSMLSLSQDVKQATLVNASSQNDMVREEWALRARKYLEEHSEVVEKQMKQEVASYRDAAKEYTKWQRKMYAKKMGPKMAAGRRLISSWFPPLVEAIKKEQALITKRTFVSSNHAKYGFVLKQIPPDELSALALHCIVEVLLAEEGTKIAETATHIPRKVTAASYEGFVTTVQLATHIGRSVESEVKMRTKIKQIRDGHRNAKKQLAAGVSSASDAGDGKVQLSDTAKKLERLVDVLKAGKLAQQEDPWDEECIVWVGARLIELLIKNCPVPPPVRFKGSRKLKQAANQQKDAEQGLLGDAAVQSSAQDAEGATIATDDATNSFKPSFSHDYFYHSKNRRYGTVCVEPSVQRMIRQASEHFVPIMPYMPMLIEPRPWTRYNSGGHLALPCVIMRTHGARQQKLALKSAKEGSLDAVYKALNVLGSTPWRVNKGVFAVLEKMWADGGGVNGLITSENVEVPPKPDGADVEELKQWRQKARLAHKTNAERHSLRADMNLKLRVAQRYCNLDQFYFPHNLDFRGRAYPLHPHLNHLGSDPSRGILEFSEGVPLGPRGLRWLKIQLANLVANGIDKLSYDEREAYADEHMEEIFNSATNPLDGSRWWLQAESPFQCLATCMDLKRALDSGDPASYVSHIHVHQDGSCNGLQHYAALGGDELGAEKVNMVNLERPADVYSGVAEIVARKVAEDATGSSRNPVAVRLNGQVDRKLVKQTVMTSVYGVTFIGARQQIYNRLSEREALAGDPLLNQMACYAAQVTLAGLSELFGAANEIKRWLADCAKLIGELDESVAWTTPLGLPVVQPYRKQKGRVVKTTLQTIQLDSTCHQQIAMKQQRTAFPPNFVHSLDSAHMMKTAIVCGDRNIRFAGVHDSFWTHAGNADELAVILREQFVELHSMPILEDLCKSFQERYPSVEFPALPARGDFALTSVLDAPYFFD